MDSLRFSPWKAPRYDEGLVKGVRVLVLGESHYNESFDKGQGLTRYVIQEHCSGRRRRAYFTKIQRDLEAAMGISPCPPSEFWAAVSFYNYIQDFITRGKRPTAAQV